MSTEFTNNDKLACARREVEQRKRVYPRLVENRRMTQQQADRQTALMEAIAEDYAKLAQGELLL